MSNYSTRGIIINIRNFGEADRLVVLLSKEKGRIESVAKGARKHTSRKSSQIELLNKGKFHFAKGKNLDIMLEADISDSIFNQSDSQSYNYLFYFSEILNSTFQVDDHLEKSVWENLEFLHNSFLPFRNVILLAAQLFVLENLGVVPDLLKCRECDADLKEIRFRPVDGIGYVCKDHAGGQRSLSDRILKIQKFLVNSELKDIIKLNITDQDFWQILEIQNSWLEHFLEKRIKSFQLLYSESLNN